MKWPKRSNPSPSLRGTWAETLGLPEHGREIIGFAHLYFLGAETKSLRCKGIYQGHHWLLHRLTLCFALTAFILLLLFKEKKIGTFPSQGKSPKLLGVLEREETQILVILSYLNESRVGRKMRE